MSEFSQPPDLGVFIDAEPEEIWNYANPAKGDHIRVSRGAYNHHGVYITDDEVIHFTGRDGDNVLDWSNNEVIKTSLEEFLRGGTLEVKEYTDEELEDLYPVDHIVHYARGCLGDAGYNLVINNCEHFANMCTLGRFRSKQVERVFDILLGNGRFPKNRSGNNMGLFGRLGDAWNAFWGKGSSKSGGRTSTTNTYTYEPDQVKIAEIEADTKLKLANKENERIELMKNARLDLLEFETKSNIALEEAKARGLQYMAETIVSMQEQLTEIAKKRFTIIESGSLQIIKEIEGFYEELADKINEDKDRYSREKLPQLLSLLQQYEQGTPAHDLYQKRINDDMLLQDKHTMMQLESVSKRQDRIIEGFMQSKERIIEHTDQITAGLIENIASKYIPENTVERENRSTKQEKLAERQTKMLE